MRLKTVEFYQSVRLWNNKEAKTLEEGTSYGLEDLKIDLADHMVTLSCSNFPDLIVVPTANMRHGRVEVGLVIGGMEIVADPLEDFKAPVVENSPGILSLPPDEDGVYSPSLKQPDKKAKKKK